MRGLMRSSTFILAGLALRHGGIRTAARACTLPVSSVGEALARLEETLGIGLVRRTDDGIALTIEARRAIPFIARLTTALQQMHGCGADQVPATSVGLEALFRTAETLRIGSIRRAAQGMGLGQPQLTRQIAQIERALGLKVALRGPTGLEPTAEGRRLMSVIERIETEWRALTGAAEAPHSRESRRYALGSVVPASPYGDLARMLGGLVARLHLRHGLRFSMISTLAEDLLVGLDSGRFDCAFLDARLRDRSYNQVEVMRGPVALACSALRPGESSPEALRLALRRSPLVLQARRSGLRQRAESYLDAVLGPLWRQQIHLIEIDSLPTIVNMVLNDRFTSVLPVHVLPADAGPPHLVLPPEFDQRLLLTWRHGSRPGRFAAIILAELEKLRPERGEPGPARPGPVDPSEPEA